MSRLERRKEKLPSLPDSPAVVSRIPIRTFPGPAEGHRGSGRSRQPAAAGSPPQQAAHRRSDRCAGSICAPVRRTWAKMRAKMWARWLPDGAALQAGRGSPWQWQQQAGRMFAMSLERMFAMSPEIVYSNARARGWCVRRGLVSDMIRAMLTLIRLDLCGDRRCSSRACRNPPALPAPLKGISDPLHF
jgi:hypothetical protein